MRYLPILFATLILAACSAAPAARGESSAASRTQVVARDSVAKSLIEAAASDFHTHRPPEPVRFRDVRLGHAMASSGEMRYMLCGEFLPGERGGKAEWTPFATIRTSSHEQWIGTQAAGICQSSSITWDREEDLSPSLQRQLDSLR